MFKKFNEVEYFFEERKGYGIKPGLDRMFYMLRHMNHPEKRIQAIHIAGTNGKGSTAEFIKAGLMNNNYRVGLFTSPSFNGLCGHIFMNNEMISEFDFIKLLNKLYPVIKQLDEEEQHPTEFEIITVIGFLYFKNAADISIIEAGMGGREDTTNCFLPILSIITSISLDHTQFLGRTVEQIAMHKAGIIKFERPVIVGELADSAFQVIEIEAKNQHAQVYKLGRDFEYDALDSNDQKQTLHWKSRNKSIIDDYDVTIQLLGRHQLNNASLAVTCFILLKQKGIELDAERYLKGMQTAKLPGRFEVIHTNPSIVLDGAHNPDGVKKFVKAAKAFSNEQKTYVLFACFKDKDMTSMLVEFKSDFSKVTLTNFDHPRSFNDKELMDYAHDLQFDYHLNWQTVIDEVLRQENNETDYFVTGSLHFILQVRNYIIANHSE